jgi:hypothetical protein
MYTYIYIVRYKFEVINTLILGGGLASILCKEKSEEGEMIIVIQKVPNCQRKRCVKGSGREGWG